MSIQLNEGQLEAFELFKKFVKDPKAHLFFLFGSPGSGKSTLLREMAKYVGEDLIRMTAPTHKAVGVLASGLIQTDVVCQTIHSFLGLRPKMHQGKQMLTRKNNYDPSANFEIRFVGLDEVSMSGEQLSQYVLEDADEWDRKYILSGDETQLNPVDEGPSPMFALAKQTQYSYTLKEPVRQAAGNPIIQAVHNIRSAINKGEAPDLRNNTRDGVGVHLMNREVWTAKLKEFVLTPNHDPDYFRVMAYTNNAVRGYNQIIRDMLGLPTNRPFSEGEMVTVNQAFVQGDEAIFNTGVELRVLHMEAMVHPSYPELEGWYVDVGMGVDVPVLDHDNCGAAYVTRINAMKEKALKSGDWRPYYALSESWCDLRPLHALTVHSSQGSTFDNIFGDYRNLYTNRNKAEADRALNVMVSRARYNAYILL